MHQPLQNSVQSGHFQLHIQPRLMLEPMVLSWAKVLEHLSSNDFRMRSEMVMKSMPLSVELAAHQTAAVKE